MTWVKICGMTNLEDALVAVEAGADAVGFVFYEKSPRCVNVETAREIAEKLPESIEKVGVFVGETAHRINEVTRRAGMTTVQVYPAAGFHRGWTDWKNLQQLKVIVAVSGQQLKDEANPPGASGSLLLISTEMKNALHAFLIDSGVSDLPGGTGTPFDWERSHIMIRGLSLVARVIVAGGLTSANVGKALDLFEPFGVDVASGVEARPGKKDPEKVRAFVNAVREMDRKVG